VTKSKIVMQDVRSITGKAALITGVQLLLDGGIVALA
jgi:hypothetical protein